MSSLPTVLIFTYPEYGQANVNLATSYELAFSGVNVYIASFPSLGARVTRLQELINRHASRSSSGRSTGSISFCECKGVTPNWEAHAKNGINNANLAHPHGVLGALESYSKMGALAFPWSQEEYLAAIAICNEIIATTKPGVVGIDPAFFAAQDACKLVDQKFVIMSPTGIKEAAVNMQPYLAAFWKYPVFVVKFAFESFSLTDIYPVQLFFRIPIPSQVVADSPQYLSLHSIHHSINDLGECETDANLA